MSWWKRTFKPVEAEDDRREKLYNELKEKYGIKTYNSEVWAANTNKIKDCQELGVTTQELRLLKEAKRIDAANNKGSEIKGDYRVDMRYVDVYDSLLNLSSQTYQSQKCDNVLKSTFESNDLAKIDEQAEILQKRVDEETTKSRTTIIIISGITLLLGTIIIYKRI